MPVPWVQLIKLAPTVLSLTNDLRRRARRLETRQEAGVDARLEEVETDLAQQSEALHALARQMEGLTEAVAALRRSLLAALALAGGALLVALSALLVFFL